MINPLLLQYVLDCNKHYLVLMCIIYILLTRNTLCSITLSSIPLKCLPWLSTVYTHSHTNTLYMRAAKQYVLSYSAISCSNLIGLFSSLTPETNNNIDTSNQNLTLGSISWLFPKIITSLRCTQRD